MYEITILTPLTCQVTTRIYSLSHIKMSTYLTREQRRW